MPIFSSIRLGWVIESISSELTLVWGFPGNSVVKNPPAMQETQVWSLGGEDPLDKEMATHSSIFAWEISRTKKLGGLHSPWDCKRVGHNLPTKNRLCSAFW